MSRRCDREGVEWPRLTYLDTLVRRTYRTLDALALIGHERRTLSFNRGNHARTLEHLRARPVPAPFPRRPLTRPRAPGRYAGDWTARRE